jgi:hypothetical protein
MIHGGMGPRRAPQGPGGFRHDPEVQVLLATDAAGEGINLQRAHLMVNYDLPWNPNRLEQRFGRIHRIGQTEVCHLWNLVAEETREGRRLPRCSTKLEEARQALGGQVFDVLGKAPVRGAPLRDLLIEAIRYGEQPDVRARLTTPSPTPSTGATGGTARRPGPGPRRDGLEPRLPRARGDGARRGAPPAAALHRVLLPGGLPAAGRHVRQREPRRYEVTHVPAPVRQRDRMIGAGEPVLAALRAHRLREVQPGRAAGPAPGGVHLPRPPAARRDHRPDARAPSRPAAPRRGAGGRARPGHQPRVLFYPGTRHSGRQPDAIRRAPHHLASGCSTSRWRPTARRATCTTPPTSTTGRWPKRAGVEATAGPAGVRLDHARPGARRPQGYAIAHVVPEHLAEVRAAAGAGSTRPRRRSRTG